MKKSVIIVFFLLLGTILPMLAQIPGLIIKPASAPGSAVLDPNADGYSSATTAGFSSNDVTESEIQFKQFVSADPSADILSGPTCGFMDIVGTDASGNYGIMLLNDGTNVIFRFRLSGYANNSKAYSVFFDTDEKFGFTGTNADPNAVPGNAGFEVEVVLETNFGVEVINVDGTTTGTVTTAFATNPYSSHCQKSMAVTTACSDPDYFYDFYIPITQLTSIAGLGITVNTPLRLAATTGMAPRPVLGSNQYSDINGQNSSSNVDVVFTNIITGTYPTTLNTMDVTGILQRSACPGINSIITSNTSITGISSESAGSVSVKVYQSDGITLIGTATTTISSGTWTVNVSSFSPAVTLSSGQIVKASVTATGKGESYDDCNPVTVSNCTIQTGIPTISEVVKISGSKGYTITISRPIGTVIYIYKQDYTLRTTADLLNSVVNPSTSTTNPQTFTFECQTGNCFTTGTYFFRFQEPGKCISPYYQSCDYSTNGTSTAPTITTSPITTSTTSITGTCASIASPGVLINLYANGIYIGATTVISSTSWTISGLNLSNYSCATITATESDNGKCPTIVASTIYVTRQAINPIINFSGCSTTSPITSISGFSTEATGSTINLYKNGSGTASGSATVQSDGTWTINSLSLVNGDKIKASAISTPCITSSSLSDEVTISTQTNIASYTIGITAPSEGSTSVSGTISGGSYGVTLKLYVDQVQVGSRVVAVAGAWTVSGLNAFDLAAGSTVKVSVTYSTNCESALSSTSALVGCVSPADKTVSVPSSLICYGVPLPVTVTSSENGTVYQLFNGASKSGSAVLGTGNNITLNSANLTAATTLTYKATKISPVTCVTTLTGNAPVSINQIYYSNGSEMLGLGNWFSNSNITGINACAFITANDHFIIPTGTTTAAGNDFTTGAAVTFQVDGVANFNTYIATVPILINNGKVQFSGITNGFAISTGTVEYNRNDGTDQTVGSGIYNNLWISGSGKKILAGDVIVNNILDLHTAGYLDLNGHTLTINNWANGHIPTLTADRYIILNGGIMTVNGVNSGEIVQFPLSLSTAQTDYCRVDLVNNDNSHTTFSLTNVFNYSNNAGTSSGGTQHTTEWVNLTYNISSTSTDANVTLYWDESKELSGFNRDNAQMNHYNGSGWEKKGVSGASSTLSGTIHYITAAANNFSPYGIGNDGSTLPIVLSSFLLSKSDSNIKINWTTQSETNNDYFNVEKSLNKENWESLYSIDGAGTSTLLHSYTFIDKTPYYGINYYRIKQTDFDGEFTYSSVKSIETKIDNVLFDIFPNPAFAEEITILVKGKSITTAILSIEDMNGKQICSGSIEISKSYYTFKLSDLCNLIPGTYNISLNCDGILENKKIVIK